MSITAITDLIKNKAVEIGFQKVGVVRAVGLAEEGGNLNEWLARGYQGEMRWMARDPGKRADPRELLEGAKSVIAVALNYFTPHNHDEDPLKGKVSRYAWGDDYHDVMGEKLRQLLGFIKDELPGVRGKACVDTSPVMDKAWAVRGGLGWLGKHTNVITKDYGSWVFLGEIIIDAELEYDANPLEDHCGSCTACLDACPTDAIVEPYVVDSNKCISYATIELRAEYLPRDIAKNLRGWLYGCDICQDVCPWNRFQKTSEEKRFEPRPEGVSPLLDDVTSLSQAEYVDKFRGSAVKRATLNGLRRNASALMSLCNAERSGRRERK